MIDEQKERRLMIATFMVQGMLAHSTRYRPRHYTNVDKQPHWHEAIVDEAFELADVLIEKSGIDDKE
jgi:hypothetical protein